jgi:benzoyl-CoA reductase/2-hydroxyglutaryl-CoA dehydratase subunit BcrC/BadD/HgdB
MSRLNENSVNMKALVAKFGFKLKEKDDEIQILEKEVIELTKENKALQRGVSIYTTSEDITKKILELRAKSYSPVKILDRCQYIGVDVDLNVIKDVVNNIDELSFELKAHYKESQRLYSEEIEINPMILKQTALNDVTYNIDKYQEMIANSDDNSEKAKFMQFLNEYFKTRNTLLKDLVIKEDDLDKSMDILDDTMKEYKENSNNIVRLVINPNEIKTIKNIS